jgi:hypothetical protein
MRIDIPSWGNIDIENIVIDLDGTIAVKGKFIFSQPILKEPPMKKSWV